jgi:hypothetical protein
VFPLAQTDGHDASRTTSSNPTRSRRPIAALLGTSQLSRSQTFSTGSSSGHADAERKPQPRKATMPPREPPTTMTTTINKMKRIRTAREDEPAVIRETDERRGNLCGELLRCQGGLSALAKVRNAAPRCARCDDPHSFGRSRCPHFKSMARMCRNVIDQP